MDEKRRLYVLRHAKSSWDDPGQPDRERPLSPRGRRAVKLLAAHFDDVGIRPELILCSPARRTRETLEAVPAGGETVMDDSLYEASWRDVVELLRRVPDEVGSVMVIGHNPAMQMLVLALVEAGAEGRGAGEAGHHLSDLHRKLPTGALATVTFDGPWSELRPASGQLAGYVRPKSLVYQ